MDVQQILDELSAIDLRLTTPGALVSGERDVLLGRRRSLQARFDALQERPDYLDQVAAYTSSLASRPSTVVRGTGVLPVLGDRSVPA